MCYSRSKYFKNFKNFREYIRCCDGTQSLDMITLYTIFWINS